MGIQINGATDSITAIDGTIDVVSAIGNAGVLTATAFVGNITGNVTGNINHTSNLELQTGGVTRAHFNSSGHFGIAGISTFSNDVKFTGNNYNVLWDKSDNSLKFDTLAKIKLADQFEFYHSTNGVLHNKSGITFIYGSGSGNISIQAQTGAQNIACSPNGGTSLYYQNSQKLYTVSDGVYLNDNLGIQDSIQHILDTNTKIRFPANDTISFETAGTERVRIASNGKLHIGGLTTNSTGSFASVIATGGELNNGGFQAHYNSGAYGGGSMTTVNAAGGGLDFWTYTGNVGGEAYSRRLRIDSSGRLLLGTTTEGHADADDFTIGTSTNSAGITIRTNTAGTGRLWFSDGTSGAAEYQGYVQYDHQNQQLILGSGGYTNVKFLGSTDSNNIVMNLVNLSYDDGTIQYWNGGLYLKTGASSGDRIISLSTANNERLRIESDGDIVATGSLSTNNLSGRNIVINGDMRVAQRATSASMSSSGNHYPTCDRWQYNRNGPSATIARVAEAPAGRGFKYSLKWTNTSPVGSIAAGNVVKFSYAIERQDIQRLGYGSADAKKATISFWAKGSLSGKIGFSCVRDSRVFSANEDIVANTWKFVEITIPADTSTGFSGDDNATGLYFGITWGAGSNATSGAVNSWINFHNAYTAGFTAGQQGAYLTTNGSTFQITGVQLEIGSQSTPFEHKLLSEEIARCKRYYNKVYDVEQQSGEKPFVLGTYLTNSELACVVNFPKMRVVPSLDITNGTSKFMIRRSSVSDHFNTLTMRYGTTTTAELYTGSGVSGTQGECGIIRGAATDTYIAFDAEL